MAYLVDRKGQSVTRKELAEVLFENTDYSRNTQNYLSKIIKELVTVLEGVGAGDILKRGLNSYAVDVNACSCDFYEYESDSATASDINRFCGEYIKQYSWGEETLAKLYWKPKDMK